MFRIIRKPVLCNYYLTYRCNARCSFCDIWEKPSPYVSLQNVEKNLIDLKKLGVKIIDFTGGEPLLHQELPDFLSVAKSMGFITTVTTNTLLYPKLAEKLKGKIDMLHFSLDSIDSEKHNASRGVSCYDFLQKSITIALELGEKPDILFTVTDENVEEIPEIVAKMTKPNGLILILNPMFSYQQVGFELNKNIFEKLRKYAKLPGVYLNEAFLVLRESGGNQIDKPVCRAASTTIVISPQNELMLPCYHLGVQNLPINDQLFELWHTEEVNYYKKMEGKLPECQGCTINCYMQPSFAVEMNRYFWKALPSTIKYSLEKWVYA